jgi:hypothetical protein
MAEREFILRRRARRHAGQFEFAETTDGRVPTGRLLGMSRAGVMLFGDRIGEERGAQGGPR